MALACALHCLAVPMLGATLQFAGVLASERTESAFLGTSLLISGTTVLVHCLRRRTSAAVWGTFAAGAAILIATRLERAWMEPFELPLVLSGAAMIVTGHVINLINGRCQRPRSQYEPGAGSVQKLMV